MSGLLQAVLRWQKPHRFGAVASRWVNWAQSIGERHGRIAERHNALTMRLVQTPPPLYLLCQRWERAAWNLCPQIILAMSPILRQTLWRGQTIAAPLPAVHRMPAADRLQALAGTFIPAEIQVHTVSPRLAPVGEPPNWQIPLVRVFARGSDDTQISETVIASRGSRQNLIVQQSLQILQRVVEERRRVEEKTRATTLVVRQQKAFSSPRHAQTTVEAELGIRGDRQQGSQFGMGSGAYAGTPPMPAISIEHLTERVVREIDRRVVAYRERIGKPL